MDLKNVTSDDISKKLSTAKMELREAELKRIYGKRWDDYRERFKNARDFKDTGDFPLYIMLEQTYKCNLACPTCVQGHESYRGKYSFKGGMSWDLYQRIVLEGEEHGLPSISTHNNDEPLLVKDLSRRIKFARDHGVMDVIMTTNGLLFTKDKIHEIIDSGVTRILFSIDAATEETYNIVRPRRNKKHLEGIEKVRWAVEEAVRYRDAMGLKLPIIRVALVVNSHNQHEIYDFIKEWIDIVDYVDIQCLLLGGILHYDDGLSPNIGEKVEDYRCNSPWGRMVIRGNGDAIICENFQGADTIIGNVNEQSIHSIFNSDLNRRLRGDCKTGNYKEPACIECAANIYTIDVQKYMKPGLQKSITSSLNVTNLVL